MKKLAILFAVLFAGLAPMTARADFLLTVNVLTEGATVANGLGKGTLSASPGPINWNGVTGVQSGNYSDSGTISLLATGKALTAFQSNISINVGDSLSLNASLSERSWKFKEGSWQTTSGSAGAAIGNSFPFTPPLGQTAPVAISGTFIHDEAIANYQYDFDGNGSWDFTSGNALNTLSYAQLLTYVPSLAPGSYDAKVRVQGGLGTFSNGYDFDLDVFSPSSVPEPSSFALMSLLAGAGWTVRRFRKRNASHGISDNS
jgi:hypothetical protein